MGGESEKPWNPAPMRALSINQLIVSLQNRKESKAEEIVQRLQDFDVDGDAKIDSNELANIMTKIVATEKQAMTYRRIAIIATTLVILSIIANFGLTFTALVLSKDIKADNGKGVLASSKTG